MDSERVLVIILAGALAVFLILGIIAIVKIIQILNDVKRIVEKAENIADRAGEVGDIFRKAAGSVAIGRVLAGVSEAIFWRRKRKNNKRRRADA